MDMLARFKNRETTANNGKLPKEDLIFTDLDLPKDELDIIYEAVRYEIGRCSKKNLYDIIGVYINLMLDIEDIFEEIKTKYKNFNDYIFQMPLHVLELSYLLKALKDFGIKLDKDDEKDSNAVLLVNQLIEKVSNCITNNYKPLKRLFVKYDKANRLHLLKDIWDNLYELTD
jgi:hypothetical protein